MRIGGSAIPGGALGRPLSFLLLLGAALAAAADCAPPPETPPLAVARVSDGDTLVLEDGRRVRLLGVNAPETAHDGRAAERHAGAARALLSSLIAAADGRVRLAYGREREDRHGRTLAYVYAGERNAGAALLQAGLAWYVVLPPDTAHAGCYRRLERTARAAGRNIWRDTPLPAGELNRSSGFAHVTGRVTGAREPAGHLVLELDGRLELFLHRDDRAAFELPAEPAGLRLEARGWLYNYRGRPNLRLRHPAMLQAAPAEGG